MCHLDFWPKNLFRRDGHVVLIDWGFVRMGSVGKDIGNLVPDACFDHFVTAEELPRLEQVVFDSYLRGLRSAGWNEDPRLVQLGMWSSAVKYDWLAPFTLAQVRLDRQYRYGGGSEIDAVFKFRERSRGPSLRRRPGPTGGGPGGPPGPVAGGLSFGLSCFVPDAFAPYISFILRWRTKCNSLEDGS